MTGCQSIPQRSMLNWWQILKSETRVWKRAGFACLARSLCHTEVCPVRDYSAPVVPRQEEISSAATVLHLQFTSKRYKLNVGSIWHIIFWHSFVMFDSWYCSCVRYRSVTANRFFSKLQPWSFSLRLQVFHYRSTYVDFWYFLTVLRDLRMNDPLRTCSFTLQSYFWNQINGEKYKN